MCSREISIYHVCMSIHFRCFGLLFPGYNNGAMMTGNDLSASRIGPTRYAVGHGRDKFCNHFEKTPGKFLTPTPPPSIPSPLKPFVSLSIRRSSVIRSEHYTLRGALKARSIFLPSGSSLRPPAAAGVLSAGQPSRFPRCREGVGSLARALPLAYVHTRALALRNRGD